MSEFFNSLFGKKPSPKPVTKPPRPIPSPATPAKPTPGYQPGDVIGGKYEVRGELGKGGFGVVYLALNRETKRLCALKTFKDEFLTDAAKRAEFKKEVLLWVNLGQHPNIVSARWVSEVSGRLFVEMEYIAPDAQGCVTLADHLRKAGGPLPIEQVLRWAAQFCAGMAHAYEHGITCHRDIKPGNILIGSDGTLKVSDFGLAVAKEAGVHGSRGRAGTPGYMAPEVYRRENAGPASDLYSFGLVLWQMAKGDPFPPFHVRGIGYGEDYMEVVYQREMTDRVPPAHEKLDSAIQTLLRADPESRHELTFDEWQAEFEALLGARWEVLDGGEDTADSWNRKGGSLLAVGRFEEALSCFDRALAVDRAFLAAWINRANAFHRLRRFDEAVDSCDECIVIAPDEPAAWSNKASALYAMGRLDEALQCYGRAVQLAPTNTRTRYNMARVLIAKRDYVAAVDCLDQVLAQDPKNADCWNNKGVVLQRLGRLVEAAQCYGCALAVDPFHADAASNKTDLLNKMRGERHN
jgi:serine/threonine protein kinase